MLKNINSWVILFVILVGFNPTLAATEPKVGVEQNNIAEAKQVVTSFQNGLLTVMQQGNNQSNYQSNYQR